MSRRSATRPVLVLLLAVTAIAGGCRDPRLQGGETSLQLAPTELDFGFVYRGASSSLSAELINSTRGKLHVSWESPSAPFFVEGLPDEVDPGTTELQLRFAPEEWGEKTAVLVARDGNTVLAKLSLKGVGQNVPECPTPVACHDMHFDLQRGECVETELADGTSCDAQSVCLLNASCRAGVCVGEPRSCDDQNACTLDLCNPISGCEHTPAPPCPGAGACTVGVCDPKLGCTTAEAPDGTVCGNVSCDSAEVCIAGSCVTRDPPDGFVCEKASPCQGEGVCSGSTCVRPPATTLSSNFDLIANSSAASPPELHDLMLEPDGSLTLSGFYERPRLRINTPGARTMEAGVRRCIQWNARLACIDHLAQGNTGSVSLIDLASGETLWSFNLASARPDFAALTQSSHLFMARVAVLGPDRLATIFEAYPANAPTTTETQCRIYFLVILNAGGQMVAASRIDDPALESCDHPHPFGVVADASGNLFMAFSSSAAGNAPLAATAPTRLFAYSRDGVLKWKRTENFVGGELATARGVLFPERSSTAYSTVSGAPLSIGGQTPFGRPIATSSLFLPSPAVSLNEKSVRAFKFLGGQAFTHTLATDEQFATAELRVVSYRSSPAEVATLAGLSFITKAGALQLHAFELETGKTLWSCPVNMPSAVTPPELFEVANGTLAAMEGALTCGDCDPPFALSTASFHTWAVPGISVPTGVPWPGTFGGADHSHRETPVYVIGASAQE